MWVRFNEGEICERITGTVTTAKAKKVFKDLGPRFGPLQTPFLECSLQFLTIKK